MGFVLRSILALFLIVGGAPMGGAVGEPAPTIAAAQPCHDGPSAHVRASDDHGATPASPHRRHDSLGHCTAASGICCSLSQASVDIEIARAMIDAAWVLPIDTDRTDRLGEPATPPPRA